MKELPAIKWHKNDPKKFNCFEDGTKVLIAVRVKNARTNKKWWDLATVVFDCDGDGAHLHWPEGEFYSDWDWSDVEYFHLIKGTMPCYAPEFDPDIECD